MPRYLSDEEVMKMNEALAKGRKYTVEEIEAMPEDVLVELIDGTLYYMATPTEKHQDLLMFLSVEICNHIREKKKPCKVYQGPLALYLNQDSETYLVPDLMVVCDRSKIENKGIVSGPDVVMEVVSPSSRTRDYILKLNKYQEAGVREYWILDPKEEKIIVYQFENEMIKIYGFQDRIPVAALDGLEIDFSGFELA